MSRLHSEDILCQYCASGTPSTVRHLERILPPELKAGIAQDSHGETLDSTKVDVVAEEVSNEENNVDQYKIWTPSAASSDIFAYPSMQVELKSEAAKTLQCFWRQRVGSTSSAGPEVKANAEPGADCGDADSTDAEFSFSQMEVILEHAISGFRAVDERRGALASGWVHRWLSQWSRADLGNEPFFSRFGVRYWLSALAKDFADAFSTGADVFTYPSSTSPV